MMPEPARVTRVEDRPSIDGYRKVLETVLEDVHLIRREFALSRGNRVVPFESASDITGNLWDRLVALSADRGFDVLILTSSELVETEQSFYEVAMSANSCFDAPAELIGLSLCLFPPGSCEFVVLVTTEGFGLVCGNDHVISKVLGRSVEDCMKEFERYVQTFQPELEGSFLASVYRSYLAS